MQGVAAEPGVSISVRDMAQTWLRDGLVIEAVYLVPSANCNADRDVYRSLLAVRGLTNADDVFRPDGAVSTPVQRLGSVLRVRLNVARSGLASSMLPPTLAPCGNDFPYRLSALHVVGQRNLMERGIDNTRDYLDTPIDNTLDAAGAGIEKAAELAADAVSEIIENLWWIVLPIAYYFAVKVPK